MVAMSNGRLKAVYTACLKWRALQTVIEEFGSVSCFPRRAGV